MTPNRSDATVLSEIASDLESERRRAFAEIFPYDDYDFVAGRWAAQGLFFATDLLRILSAELFAQQIPHGTHLRLLDVGAGPGYGTEFIARLFATEISGYTMDCTALELSSQWARFYPGEHSHTDIVVGDLFDQPDGTHDYVVCSHVIEHLAREDVGKFVRKMTTVARRAAIVICPWEEPEPRHPAHIYSADRDLIRELQPDHWETFRSLGWNSPNVSYCLGMVFRRQPLPAASVAKGWLSRLRSWRGTSR